MSSGDAVVIGVGNEYRRDDGVGVAVLAELPGKVPPGTRLVLSDGEPAGLLDAWSGAGLAIVVDAVYCEPSTPGRIWRSTVDGLPPSVRASSSHALGIPDAVRLGAALEKMPDRLVVLAVEAADLDLGTGLSGPVSAALPEIVRVVLAELGSSDGPG
ncbi:hydrogenase maturation protease [Amycolatopsis orientalis]|uniref:hydrogenase maturation protease n=1 Tax=Amycolatopsis orientalis TaxID=31958 RepID=UPI000417E5A4|nr:hydrogenase maturation protease [Amycolatopsis orientalis]